MSSTRAPAAALRAGCSISGVRQASAEIRKVYDLLGVKDRYIVQHPDHAHDFTDESRRGAYRFIDAQLGFKPTREVP